MFFVLLLYEFIVKGKTFEAFKSRLALVFAIVLTEYRTKETMFAEVVINIRILKISISISPLFKVDMFQLHVFRSATLWRYGYSLSDNAYFCKVRNLIKFLQSVPNIRITHIAAISFVEVVIPNISFNSAIVFPLYCKDNAWHRASN